MRRASLGITALLLLAITIVVARWEPRRVPRDVPSAAKRVEASAGLDRGEDPRPREAIDAAPEAAVAPDVSGGASAADEGTCVVRVQDVAGVPIAGVEVHLVPDAPWEERSGFTDASGSWRFPSADLPAYLISSHPMYATRLVRVTSADPRVILVVLRRAVRITGIVETRGGALPETGLLVHAIPVAHTSVLERTGGARELLLRSLRAEVGADGRFEFTDLDPTAEYDLLAGGAGFLGAEPVRWTNEVVGDVHLVVDRVVGLLVHVRDVAGEPLSTAGDFNGQVQALLPRALREAALTPCAAALAGLAGVEAPEPGAVRPEDELLLFVDPTGGALPVGPIEFRARFPGYEEIRETVWLEAAFPRLAEVWLAATPTFDGLGKLSVEFTGLAPGTRSAPTMVSLALLPISGGDVLERFFGIPEGDSFTLRLDAVPCGVYELRTVALHGQFVFPQAGVQRVTVSPGESSSVQIDASHCGRVRLRLTSPDGSTFDGGVSVEVSPAQGNRSQASTLVFEGPPYGIPLLPEGIYRFELQRPEFARDEAQEAQVQAGREVEVRFRL